MEANPLKKFDESDWQCYNGCKTDSPEIAYLEDYAVILDGNEIEIVYHDADQAWHREFGASGTARYFAEKFARGGDFRKVLTKLF